MAIHFYEKDEKIILEYSPEGGIKWLEEKLNEENSYSIKGIFTVSNEDIDFIEVDLIESISFIIGEVEENYKRIYSHVLGTESDVLIAEELTLQLKHFLSSKTSILKKMEKLANQQIIIGGELENNIPLNDFKNLIERFPTQTEKDYYANARITNILSQYLDNVKDYGDLFEKYLNKQDKRIKVKKLTDTFKKYEYKKYTLILEKLKNMLKLAEPSSEESWGLEILEIILLLFPKYVQCLPKVTIRDAYANKNRQLDFMLLDSNNCVDIIEIKKPAPNHIIRNGMYRENYTPQRELSGTVMQVEKYLFHLNKWGLKGEETLTKKYEKKLLSNQSIKILNPKGLIIIGRDNNLSGNQLFDFEIIKRKYANMIDIITYDDLIRRLELLIEKFT